MNTEWKTATKYIIGVAIAILILYLLYISRSVLYILIGAALISLILRPLILFFIQRLRMPRLLAVILAHIVGLLLFLLAPMLLIPPILDAVSALLEIDYQILIDDSLFWLESTLSTVKENGISILGVKLVMDTLIDPILAYLQGVSPEFQPSLPSYEVIVNSIASAFTLSFGLAISVVGSVLAGFVAFLFLILSSIYISLDGPKFYRSFLKWFPESQRSEVATLNKRIRNTWDGFFKGQLALMFIIGVSVWLGLTILGVPGAFALGVIAGLLEIVPSIGPIIATIPAVIVALIQGSLHFEINHFIFALIVIGFYTLIQLLENYIVVPQVLGGAVKLHPLVVIAGVLIGASVWGILGALLAAPLIASLKEVLEYIRHKLTGEDPFPVDDSVAKPETSWWEAIKLLIMRGQKFAQTKIPITQSPSKSAEEKKQSEEDEIETERDSV